jgi:hypothetical protein
MTLIVTALSYAFGGGDLFVRLGSPRLSRILIY